MNNFALSATDIGDAMQRSASVLAASNTSFDESIALITAGNEIIQDPEKMGTALRTIALRIRGAKSELEEMGEETDYVVNSTSKLRELIRGYTSINGKYEGFDIMEDEDTFKSLADIIKGIGEVYDEMSDIDRTAMLEKLAGKNRSNALAAMLQNYKQIDAVLRSIEESEGSAMRENEHIVDSIQGRMTQLQTAGENFWQEFIDTDAIKNAVSALTELLNVLTKVVGAVGLAPVLTAGTGIGLVASEGGVQRYRQIKNIERYANREVETATLDYNKVFSDYENTNIRSEINDINDLSEAFEENAKAYAPVAEASAELTEKQDALARANKAAKQSFKNDLKPALINLGITAAISILVAAISNYIKKCQEAKDATRELAKETQDNNKSLDEYVKKISEARSVIDDEKSSTAEIIEAKKTLVEVQDQLNEKYSNYNDIIKDVNSTLEETNELLIAQRIDQINDALREAQDTGSHWYTINKLDNEYDNAINTFFGDGSGFSLEGYGGRTYENIDDLIDAYRQIMNEYSEYDNTYQWAANHVKQLEKERSEYRDLALLYGESEASDLYNEQYTNLMKAYYANIQEGTEESEALVKANLQSLWESAEAENNLGVKYWLESMFDTFFDEINNAKILERWSQLSGNGNTYGDRIERILGMLSNTSENERSLVEADLISYLNGNEIKNVSERQIPLLKLLKDTIIEAGYEVDEYGALVHKFVSDGLLYSSIEEASTETEIRRARQNAIDIGLMTGEQFDALGISTNEELDAWIKIRSAANEATEAARMYYLETSGIGKTTDPSEILSDMQEQYKPAFDALAESYKAIWTTDGFKIDKVTSEQINSVNSQLKSFNEKLKESGLDGITDDLIDDFIVKLSNTEVIDEEIFGTDKAKEVQEAYNDIATAIINNLVPSIGQASGATIELIQKQLTELGVTNAEAVVMSRLGYTVETYAAAKEAAAEADIDLDAEISSLDKEQIALIANNEALMEYYKGRLLAGSIEVSTEDDVNALLNMCKALDIAKIGSLELAKVQKDLAYANSLMAQGIEQNSLAMQRDAIKIINETINAVKNAGKEAGVEWENAIVDGNAAISSDKSGSDSKQKFDWIERAIKKIQRAVTNLGKVADATYKTWGERLDAIMGKTQEFHDELGRYGQGNIDLYNRPRYLNEDGSVSTVRSMSFGDEFGNEILVPTIAFDNNGRPYSMSDDEAIARYYETGEYLGLFKSVEEAEEYAEKLHEQQEALYTDNVSAGKYQKLKEEIALQEQAAQAYMAEANAIGLAAEYRSKVMNGLMDIETVTDEKLKEQISDFQEYYDKSTDAADAVEDLRAELAQLAQTKFDYITKQFEEMALTIDHTATRIGHIQSKIASEGYFESTLLLERLKDGSEERLVLLQNEAAALAASIDEAVSNGDIEYGSEQWWGMYDSLQNVNDQVVELTANIADYNDQIRQLEWDKFDYIADSISRLTDENDFLIEVLEDEELMFEKNAKIGEDMYANGNMSDAALAVQGLHVNNLQILKEQTKDYAEEIEKINAELANDPNNKKLLERRNTLIDQQQSIIKGITSEKQAIKSLIKEGYDTFLDYLQRSIDYRKRALNAQKNLFDYERTVREQTDTISSYRKQLAALGGDDSEENRARLQQITNNLKKAEEDLQQTEYDKWLSDQEEMMDNMYDAFEKLINDRLDNLDALVERAITQTSENADGISDTIETTAGEFLYDLDDTSFGINMDARMSDAISAVDAVKNAIEAMKTEADIHATNELNALDALAQTVANAANAAKATPVVVQTNTSSGGGGGDGNDTSSKGKGSDNGGDVTYDKQTNTANSQKIRDLTAQIETREEQLRQLEKQKSEKETELANIPDVFGTKDARNALKKTISNIQTKINDLQDLIDKDSADLAKLRGFAKGGTIGNAIRKTGEDGIILARTGEEVLSVERVKQMQGIFKMMEPLTNIGDSNIGGSTTVNGMQVSFDLPNVASYADFVRQAKSDPSFEKLVQNITIGTALGKSKLSKYS